MNAKQLLKKIVTESHRENGGYQIPISLIEEAKKILNEGNGKSKLPNFLAIHKANLPKSDSAVSAIKNLLVKDGKLISTDFEITLLTPTDKPDGIYKIYGKTLDKGDCEPEEFPKIEIAKGKSVTIPYPWKKLNKALGFVSNDTLRMALTGVLFDVRKDFLILVATNGHILYRKKLSLPKQLFEERKQFIVPPKALKLLLRDKISESLTITFADKHIVFKTDLFTLQSNLIDEIYVDVDRFLKRGFKGFKKVFRFNTSQLSAAVNYLAQFKPKDFWEEAPIIFEQNEKGFELSLENLKDEFIKTYQVQAKEFPAKQSKDFYDDMVILMPVRVPEARIKENVLQFCFNADYLKAVLKNHLEPTIDIYFKNNERGMVIK